jgi:hypothetical protein
MFGLESDEVNGIIRAGHLLLLIPFVEQAKHTEVKN